MWFWMNCSNSWTWKFAYICIPCYPHCSLWLFLFTFQLFSHVSIQLPQIVYGTLKRGVCVYILMFVCIYMHTHNKVFSFLFGLISFVKHDIKNQVIWKRQTKEKKSYKIQLIFFPGFILASKTIRSNFLKVAI